MTGNEANSPFGSTTFGTLTELLVPLAGTENAVGNVNDTRASGLFASTGFVPAIFADVCRAVMYKLVPNSFRAVRSISTTGSVAPPSRRFDSPVVIVSIVR